MKSMGGGILLSSGRVTAMECLHYSMSLPVATLITGIDRSDILQQALSAVKTFKPLSVDDVSELLKKTVSVSREGRYELFKTTPTFDGTAKHPEWLE